MRMFHDKTVDAARGKWRGILIELGVPASLLTGKHVACPLCTSKDNFRFDDKGGRGSWICTCGAGTGMDLAMRFTGRAFQEVADRIDTMVRNVKPDAPKQDMSDEDRRVALRRVWKDSQPVVSGDLAHRYLIARGIGEMAIEDAAPALRFAKALQDGEGGIRPAMVALVTGPDGKASSLHRTFLRPDGLAKAEMPSPRKLMPGPVAEGSAIRLGPANKVLGIAEGIETALAAGIMYEISVWSAITAGMLEKWQAPEGTEEVCIFADADESFTGQAAAYALAKRLKLKDIEVHVKTPDRLGRDWLDVLNERNTK